MINSWHGKGVKELGSLDGQKSWVHTEMNVSIAIIGELEDKHSPKTSR